MRLGWNGQLSLRAVGAGTVGKNDPLPIQRRLSLGGPDPMPRFSFRQFACNAAAGAPTQTALCDRILLFQAEYRGNLRRPDAWRFHFVNSNSPRTKNPWSAAASKSLSPLLSPYANTV